MLHMWESMMFAVPCFQKEQSRETFLELLFSPYLCITGARIYQQLRQTDSQALNWLYWKETVSYF